MIVGSQVQLRENSSIDDLMFSKIPFEGWKLNDNPLNMNGTIISIGNKRIPALPIVVLWENGLRNSYSYEHLIEMI